MLILQGLNTLLSRADSEIMTNCRSGVEMVSEQRDPALEAAQRAEADLEQHDDGDWTDVLWAIIVFSAVLGVLILHLLVYTPKDLQGALLLTAAFGAIVGWGLGILATPYNKRDADRLGRIGQVGYAALTGYVVAKLDRVLEAFIGGGANAPVRLDVLVFVIYGIIMLIATGLLTYVTRSYGGPREQAKTAQTVTPDAGQALSSRSEAGGPTGGP
jgi:hypothetical protein